MQDDEENNVDVSDSENIVVAIEGSFSKYQRSMFHRYKGCGKEDDGKTKPRGNEV